MGENRETHCIHKERMCHFSRGMHFTYGASDCLIARSPFNISDEGGKRYVRTLYVPFATAMFVQYKEELSQRNNQFFFSVLGSQMFPQVLSSI